MERELSALAWNYGYTKTTLRRRRSHLPGRHRAAECQTVMHPCSLITRMGALGPRVLYL